MNFSNKAIKKQSVTLMELIVAMTIVGFVIAAVITYNLIGEKFYHSTSRQATVLNDAQYVIKRIGQDLKEATNTTNTFGGQAIITTLTGSTITYSLNNGNITRSQGSQDEVLASNVREFDITTSGKTAKVTVSVEIGETEKTRQESTYVSTFYLRNK
ncbi:MAG: hypothetical protein PHQ54_03335 [Candidatus Omnitrophica bacterium]|nr:hypothetical protein [Candidatus Omnitrophota bacterium]